MPDEPELPPDDEQSIEELADEIAAEETEWDGTARPPAPAERGPGRLGLVALAVVALLAGAGTTYALTHHGGSCPSKGNVVEVEGQKIPGADYQRRIKLLQALYDVKPPTDAKPLVKFKGDAAKGMVLGILIDHDVAKRSLQVADTTVRDRLDIFISQGYPKGGKDQFTQALVPYGLSEADILGEFRHLLDTQALFQAVTPAVTVSEDQVTKAFSERKDRLAVPERRHIRHLVVATEEEAKKALTRVKGAETFADVAKSVSLDASTKAQGGDLGIVAQAQLDPAFGAAAFAVAKGQTFGPVQTKNGWHIGLVEDITAGRPVTLAEVHDALKDTVLAEARLATWRTYLGDRIKGAKACYAKGFEPEDPKAPPPDLTPSTLEPSPGP